jgi:hypothetical protein
MSFGIFCKSSLLGKFQSMIATFRCPNIIGALIVVS